MSGHLIPLRVLVVIAHAGLLRTPSAALGQTLGWPIIAFNKLDGSNSLGQFPPKTGSTVAVRRVRRLYDLYRKNFGKDNSPVLVLQATARELNPTLSEDYLARMEREDPEAYRSEVLGEFRKGVSTLLDPDALQACVDEVTRERLPEDVVSYHAFVDASTGGGRDKFAVAVAIRAEDRRP
jgi:hypothetical protein